MCYYGYIDIHKASKMRHSESSFLYTDIYYDGKVKRFIGFNHRRRALDFYYSLPAKSVKIELGQER